MVWHIVGVDDTAFNEEDDKPMMGERSMAGSVLLFTFGFVVVLIMMNVLIAMLSATFEAVKEIAETRTFSSEALYFFFRALPRSARLSHIQVIAFIDCTAS